MGVSFLCVERFYFFLSWRLFRSLKIQATRQFKLKWQHYSHYDKRKRFGALVLPYCGFHSFLHPSWYLYTRSFVVRSRASFCLRGKRFLESLKFAAACNAICVREFTWNLHGYTRQRVRYDLSSQKIICVSLHRTFQSRIATNCNALLCKKKSRSALQCGIIQFYFYAVQQLKKKFA